MDKKQKKKEILKRNKRTQIILQHMRQHAAEEDLIRDQDERKKDEKALRDKKDKKDEEVAWSAKLQMVRNRLTGDKHMAQERWNRFAGTEDAGARGR